MEAVENAAPTARGRAATQAKAQKGRKKTTAKKGLSVASASAGNARSGAPPQEEGAERGGRSIEETYQMMTQIQHVLARPDTYVGSTDLLPPSSQWVRDDATGQLVRRDVEYAPALLKIFDEVLVNAADNKQRDPRMSEIRVRVEGARADSTLSVYNDGNGIPVEVHREHGMYVPEFIFGNLLTGSNFDDDQRKTTGGRNGFGAKLANIYSRRFTVETCCNGKYFRMVWTDNMQEKGEAFICSAEEYYETQADDLDSIVPGAAAGNVNHEDDFTRITFEPDLQRFSMTVLDNDMMGMIGKRVCDMAGIASGYAGAKLRVYLNDARIPARTFAEYIGLYRGLEEPIVSMRINDRWEIAVGVSEGRFEQISFVNAICTLRGGKHVDYIADQVAEALRAKLKKANKGTEVKPQLIMNNLAIYVNCLIENPAFDSQTKETLTTRPANFGSTCDLPNSFVQTLQRCDLLLDSIVNSARRQQENQLKRKGGSKRSKITGIAKLEDAGLAGTRRSQDCTLILTEGDSAKTLAVAGLTVVGRELYGVFPLKGKPLNVRDAAHAQIMKNEELQNICKIMGLQYGKEYTDTSSLRYGHLMIMADQDTDGSHIKGLIINFIHHNWPSLLQVRGFLQQFITPIVVCSRRRSTPESFFTMTQYGEWKQQHNNGRGWKIKYYKGLGSSTTAEGKLYFGDLRRHVRTFNHCTTEVTDDLIDLAFNKRRADDRKTWLSQVDPNGFIDYDVRIMNIEDFINDELSHFSAADNVRSIGNRIDGLKPAQRKAFWGAVKKNVRPGQEIKVASLSGFVTERCGYHHGEVSMNETIIKMAHDYPGSNNVNLLEPIGQFGSRQAGGKDAASARYISTSLSTLAQLLFRPEDLPILEHAYDDGQEVEPVMFLPILPLALINGTEGIGTGWSTTILPHDPLEVIENLRHLIEHNDDALVEMYPWWRGFHGEIVQKTTAKGKPVEGTFLVRGILERTAPDTVVITELPAKKWTQDYKGFLMDMMPQSNSKKAEEDAFVLDMKEDHSTAHVHFELKCHPDKLDAAEGEPGGLIKKFKLETSVSANNMHLFDEAGNIHRYDSALDILREFYHVRLEGYVARRASMLERMELDHNIFQNKLNFMNEVMEDELVVFRRKRRAIVYDLLQRGYMQFMPNQQSQQDRGNGNGNGGDGDSQGESENYDDSDEDSASSDTMDPNMEIKPEHIASEDELTDVQVNLLYKRFRYLLSIPMGDFEQETLDTLETKLADVQAELATLRNTTPEQMWLAELDEFAQAFERFCTEWEAADASAPQSRGRAAPSRPQPRPRQRNDRPAPVPRQTVPAETAEVESKADGDKEEEAVQTAVAPAESTDSAAAGNRKRRGRAAAQSKSSASSATTAPAASVSALDAIANELQSPPLAKKRVRRGKTPSLSQAVKPKTLTVAASPPKRQAPRGGGRARKVVYVSDDDDDDDVVDELSEAEDSDSDCVPTRVAPQRRGRACKVSDDDDDDEVSEEEEEQQEEEEEVDSPPKRLAPRRGGRARKVVYISDDDDDDDELSEAEDSDSDYVPSP